MHDSGNLESVRRLGDGEYVIYGDQADNASSEYFPLLGYWAIPQGGATQDYPYYRAWYRGPLVSLPPAIPRGWIRRPVGFATYDGTISYTAQPHPGDYQSETDSSSAWHFSGERNSGFGLFGAVTAGIIDAAFVVVGAGVGEAAVGAAGVPEGAAVVAPTAGEVGSSFVLPAVETTEAASGLAATLESAAQKLALPVLGKILNPPKPAPVPLGQRPPTTLEPANVAAPAPISPLVGLGLLSLLALKFL